MAAALQHALRDDNSRITKKYKFEKNFTNYLALRRSSVHTQAKSDHRNIDNSELEGKKNLRQNFGLIGSVWENFE